MSEKKKEDLRSRTWTIITYPDSVPENWRELLDKTHVAWVESPLHDSDKNADGTVKKPHWHIVLMFGSKKSYSQIVEIAEMLHGAHEPQKVHNVKGAVRYLIHFDNPEKFRYNREDIRCHGGADVDQYFELSMSSRTAVLRELMEFVSESEIDNYDDLIMYCIRHGEDDWFDIAVNHNTLAINKQLDAIYQKKNPKNGQKVDILANRVSVAKEMAKNGAKNAVIADTLGVSERTVWRYLKK